MPVARDDFVVAGQLQSEVSGEWQGPVAGAAIDDLGNDRHACDKEGDRAYPTSEPRPSGAYLWVPNLRTIVHQ